MKTLKLPILLVLFGLLISSCGGDNEDSTPEDPDIPPLSTMVMDFRDFTDASIDPEGGRVRSKNNWGWAALNVGVWNTLIVLNLITPVAAFKATVSEEPTFDPEEGKWIWEKEFMAVGKQHSARLSAQLSGPTVNWEMFVSKEGEFEDFQWYTGESNLTNTSGSWTLSLNPNDPTPFLEIEWNRSGNGDEADIRYTNIFPGQGSGGYIFYGKTTEESLNRFYEIFQASENNTVEIRWTFEDKSGQIKDPRHFEDEEYHCWDENLDDIDC